MVLKAVLTEEGHTFPALVVEWATSLMASSKEALADSWSKDSWELLEQDNKTSMA